MPLEVARRAPGPHGPFLAQHGDDAAVAADRDGEHPSDRRVVAVGVDLALDLDTGGRRLGDEARLDAVGPRSDVVGDVHRLVRGRADLVDDEPATLGGLDVQQQVGETEVGEEAPLGGQPVQVIDVVAPEGGVLA